MAHELQIKWPKHRDFALLDANTFVSSDLKHNDHKSSPASMFLNELGEDVFGLIENLAANDTSQVRQQIDEVREKLAVASEVLGPLLAPAERVMRAKLNGGNETELLPEPVSLDDAYR
ncbi:MAG: hypothetical protein ACK58T_43145, partial [Phycisphaerae bacterium]